MSDNGKSRKAPKKEVWILGAGFSYPLGAPLFWQLYQPKTQGCAGALSNREARDFHESAQSGHTNRLNLRLQMAGLYRTHLQTKDGKNDPLWDNAETFIKTLSDVAELGEVHPLFPIISDAATEACRQILGFDAPSVAIQKFLEAAKTELALEVSYFLYHQEFNSEIWRPYREWMRSLTPFDTLITFNYDEAVERLGASYEDGMKLKGIFVPTPETQDRELHRLRRLHPMLLKMHGSTNWEKEKHIGDRDPPDMPYVLKNTAFVPDIYIPGSEKVARTEGSFLWSLAEEAIRSADRIHVVGYRFPDTDVFAQDWILRSIRPPSGDNEAADVRIVLGPNVHSEHVQRLQAIFETVADARPERMFAQDYIWHVTRARRNQDRSRF